jgi:hypothetical protein
MFLFFLEKLLIELSIIIGLYELKEEKGICVNQCDSGLLYFILFYFFSLGFIVDPSNSSRCIPEEPPPANCSAVTPVNGTCTNPCYFEWFIIIIIIILFFFFF